MKRRLWLGLGVFLMSAGAAVGGTEVPAESGAACTLPITWTGSGSSLTGTITGTIPTGTFALSNAHIVISDATISACSGTTFALAVTNGTITVGGTFGIYGKGSDGASGTAGGFGNVPPTPGVGGGTPFNVSLTTKNNGGAFDGSISVLQPIDVRGGNGGGGGSGEGENRADCTPGALILGQSGELGGVATGGGTVTISAYGNIGIDAAISVDGGSGGSGGSAGYGTFYLAGTAASGRGGAGAGKISISHASNALSGAILTFGGYTGSTACSVGTLSARGGDGGSGGSGATGYGSSTGGAGGVGGNGGMITINARDVAIDGYNNVNCPLVSALITVGGSGGAGGRGGSSANGGRESRIHLSNVVCSYVCESQSAAEVAGAGGDGGHGGPITITSAAAVSLSSLAQVLSDGGNGGIAGVAGDGSAKVCDLDCNNRCPAVTGAGLTTNSAPGGNAGVVHITAATQLSCGLNGGVWARGGTGGNGAMGAAPGAGCCLACEGEEEPRYGVTQDGGSGGVGGHGNHIYLAFSVRTGYANFFPCGGDGGLGGDGGPGNPTPGAGGADGASGTQGYVFYNTVQQSLLCDMPTLGGGDVGEVMSSPCILP